MKTPQWSDVVAAAGRLQGRIRETPVIHAQELSARCDRQVFLKCENLQHAGAFKFRGASNALLTLAEHGIRPSRVVTHSSGNHGAALARAARELGWPCTVVIPRDGARVKREAVVAQGAEVKDCEPGIAAREAAVAQLMSVPGTVLVHPYDDAMVIAGQGTAALELLTQVDDLQVLATPIGGGGLLAGTVLAARATSACRIFGVEPLEADDAARSLRTGKRCGFNEPPQTIADGLKATLGQLPFEICSRGVDGIVTVSEAAIIEAMRVVLEDCKLLIEPSSAVPIAALLKGELGAPGERVGIILSGGNVDLTRCPFLSGSA